MDTIRAGEDTRLSAEMTPAQAIVMEAFTVATQREGHTPLGLRRQGRAAEAAPTRGAQRRDVQQIFPR